MRLDEAAAARADVDNMLAELRAGTPRDDDHDQVTTAVYHAVADDMGVHPAEATREIPAARPPADEPPWWAVDLHRRLLAVETLLRDIREAL